MIIDATFWVAVSFFLFLGLLIYLKIPQKVSISLNDGINSIKKEINEAEKIRDEVKNILNEHENKLSNVDNEIEKMLKKAKDENEKILLEKTEKFHELMENKKRLIEQKINVLKKNAFNDVKNAAVKVSLEATINLIRNSLDKNKLDKFFNESLEHTKSTLKKINS